MACAGVIVFREESKMLECVLVRQGGTRIGFPKGTLEKKKGKRESVSEGGIRELKEESGIDAKDVKFKMQEDGGYVTVSEYNQKGNRGVIYLIGRFIGPADFKLTFDAEIDPDIDEVFWFPVEDALKILTPKRRDVLKEAVSKL